MGLFNWKKKRKEAEQQSKTDENIQAMVQGVKTTHEVGEVVQEESEEEKIKALEESLKKVIHKSIDIFDKFLGISIPKKYYPQAGYKKTGEAIFSGVFNMIGISSNSFENGQHYGEEIGHFHRAYFRKKATDNFQYNLGPEDQISLAHKNPDKKEVSEFFGYLGRKIFQKAQPNMKGIKFSEESLTPKEEIVGMTKEELEEDIAGSGLDEKGKQNMRDHWQGYNWASRINIGRIKKWETLFSMPQEEVRRRFFTPNPDYSGL